jgi:membrane-associated phospholipid phosphatase
MEDSMLESLHELEIAWSVFIQSLGAWLGPVMNLVSLMGSENFFFFVMPVLYWSFNAGLGLRLAVVLLLSNVFSPSLKLIFHGSRPYWLSPHVIAYSAESNFGFPSGHSQTAASIWGFLATQLHGTAVKILLVLAIFLIGFSRIFLGVHYVSDVLGGWLVGALLVWAFLRLEKPAARWLKTLSLRQMLLLTLLTALILAALILVPAAASQNWQMPSDWEQNALTAAPDMELNPLDINTAFTAAGTWLGLMAGAALLYHSQGGCCTDGTPQQRLLRYLIGLAGVFVFYYVLGQLFPRDPDLLSYSLRFLRYTLVGLWVSMIAPLVFQRMGLSISYRQREALVNP